MKKPKRKTKYLVINREFDNFKSFKTFAWLTRSPGEVTIGIEYFGDTIYKEYKIKRTEGRLIVEKIYDMWEGHLQQIENLQLKLF